MSDAVLVDIGLVVDLRLETDGPVVAIEPVREADLREPISEVWWRGYARHGDFATDECDMDVSILALEREGRCVGFQLRSRAPTGVISVTCSREALVPVAERGARTLVQLGQLESAGAYYYDLRVDDPASRAVNHDTPPSGRVVGRARDMRIELLPLDDLVAASREVGETAIDDRELFFTESALRDAERIARCGESSDPPIETGGVLLGVVAFCDVRRDAFVVVTDALEAADAEHDQFSLTFSSRTWQRIDGVVRARTTRPVDAALRVLGQVHGHPFTPTDHCFECPHQSSCSQHSAALSNEDRRWSRAVFCAQPWQVGQLFGADPRRGPTSTVYGLRGGRLEARGYRVVSDDDFSLTRETSTQANDR